MGRIQELLNFLSLPFYKKREILLQQCDILFATCSGNEINYINFFYFLSLSPTITTITRTTPKKTLFIIFFFFLSGLASQRSSWMDQSGVNFDICMVEEAGKLTETFFFLFSCFFHKLANFLYFLFLLFLHRESLLLLNEKLSRLILIGDDKQLSGILNHKTLSSDANYSQVSFLLFDFI